MKRNNIIKMISGVMVFGMCVSAISFNAGIKYKANEILEVQGESAAAVIEKQELPVTGENKTMDAAMNSASSEITNEKNQVGAEKNAEKETNDQDTSVKVIENSSQKSLDKQLTKEEAPSEERAVTHVENVEDVQQKVEMPKTNEDASVDDTQKTEESAEQNTEIKKYTVEDVDELLKKKSESPFVNCQSVKRTMETPKSRPLPTPEPVYTPSVSASAGAGSSESSSPYYSEGVGPACLAILNAYRAEVGAPALAWDDSLYAVAAARCAEIVNDMSHNGQRTTAECLAATSTMPSAEYAAGMWRGSAGHYELITIPAYARAAVACYRCNGRTYYAYVAE